MSDYRIVFMGTPDFAVPALRALHDHGHRLLAVVTQPDRPRGRGQRVTLSPVKHAANALGSPVLQPTSVKEPWFLDKIVSIDPDLLVVVAYGHILPGSFLAIPRLGAINVHASLLPKYRGPAPIQWAIMNGEQETGVTTMWMDEGMDTGDILLTARTRILEDDTAQTLHDRLSGLGASLLIETLAQLERGVLVPVAQDRNEATYAPLLKKEDGRIDWTKDAKSIDTFIRGVTPWPGAFTFLGGKRLKVLKAAPLEKKSREAPATVVEGFPGELNVATGSGVLALKEVQLESGKRLSVEAFLRGYSIGPGAVLG